MFNHWLILAIGFVFFVGCTGPAGPAGPQGPPGRSGLGLTGRQGEVGPLGIQGSQGTQGDIGATGEQGLRGVPGRTGSLGSEGRQGPQGDTGSVGPQGQPGMLTTPVITVMPIATPTLSAVVISVPTISAPTALVVPTIRDTVINALGKSNRDIEGLPSDFSQVRSVELSTDGEGDITVQWVINSGGVTKDEARTDIVEILKAVDISGMAYKRVTVIGTFLLIDVYGVESEDSVVRAVYDRDTIERINWDNFQSDNVFRIAYDSMIHEDLRKNGDPVHRRGECRHFGSAYQQDTSFEERRGSAETVTYEELIGYAQRYDRYEPSQSAYLYFSGVILEAATDDPDCDGLLQLAGSSDNVIVINEHGDYLSGVGDFVEILVSCTSLRRYELKIFKNKLLPDCFVRAKLIE